MFGGLLLGKFSKKCKQAVRCIKLRAEPIKKKKRVVVRILKKDVADLIAAGHESNAFGRMNALIVEMNLLFCYEMIEEFCECILNQLPTLQKQRYSRECPEESSEAISTLIYAAARFSDLPELRDLRSLFTERYGNCAESSVNAEFADKTNRKSFSREWKLKAMQEIAEELSVSRSGERNQESCNPPSPKSAGQAQTKRVSPPLNEEIERIDKHRIEMETTGVHVASATKHRKAFELQTMAPPESNTESHAKPRRNHDVGSKIEDRREVLESIQEEDIDHPVKPSKPKPVGKARAKIKNEVGKSGNGRVHEIRRQGMVATDELDLENQPVAGLKMNPPFVMKPNMMNNAPKKLDGDSDTEKPKPKPKPFSVRKKLQKPPVNDTDDNAVDEETPTGLAREELDSFIALGYGQFLRRGLSEEKGQDRRNGEAIQDERDEEENILDDLLLYYSRKGTDKDSKMDDDRGGNAVAHQNENGDDGLIPRIKVPPPPKRTCSLPSESISLGKTREPVRVSSLQSSDRMSRHSRSLVHPRLPDYDQLAARFAALKNG